jgi:putative transposase
MRRAYKFRLRPTARQHVALGQCLKAHRDLYNAALQERRDAYERVVKRSPLFYGPNKPKSPVKFTTQSAQLPDIRQADSDTARWGSGSEQATLKVVDRAFAAFFRRVDVGQIPGYPRFRAEHRFDSVLWPSPGDACKWKPETGRVYLQGIGNVKVTVHREVMGTVKTIQVKREGRRWFLILSCDDVPARLLEPTGAVVGVDVGVNVFLGTSDGLLVENPRHGRNGAARLKKAQVALARKKKGSNNRRQAREVVANRHRKVASQRRDFHHQVARRLVDNYDLIVLEKLKVTNMTRSAKGTVEKPGTNVAQKSGLNRSILDAGWAQFRSIIEGKAEDAGRQVIVVNPRYTSQRCASCGHVEAGNRVDVVFRCLKCGHSDQADINAAINILRAGLALLATQAA